MSKKFFLIDGSSFMFRAYFALPPLTNAAGQATHAVYGFVNMILKLIKDKKPDYVAVVFDRPEPTWRKVEYEAYKANREAAPEDLVSQIPLIKESVHVHGLLLLEQAGFEADDIIASLVKKYRSDDLHLYIISSDKDLMQLVSQQVLVYDPMKDKIIGEDGVQEKFGLAPNQIQDMLALMGDSSDNIPGVPGIGPKTAATLLQKYQTLENIYEHLHELKGKQLENLTNHKSDAFLSKRLAGLSCDLALDYELENFVPQAASIEARKQFYQTMGFTRMLAELNFTPPTVVPLVAPTENLILVDHQAAWLNLLSKLAKVSEFAFDTKTTSLDMHQAQWVGISFAFAADLTYYVPLDQTSQLDRAMVLAKIKTYLENPALKKIGYNTKHHMHVLAEAGIMLAGLSFDTMIAAYLINPTISHAAETAAATWSSYEKLVPELSALQLQKLFDEIEMPVLQVLLAMEQAGIMLDTTMLAKLEEEYQQKLNLLEIQIYEVAGSTFNIQSPKQLGKVLFEDLKLPIIKKTKTGYSTDVDVLEDLAASHALPKLILDFRSLAKLLSTYIKALPLQINPKTGRVHTTYQQTIAETGRLSSVDPNLQNIPIRSESGRRIRQAFIAKPGYQLISADYSQIELRLLAHCSGDVAMLKAFADNEDIHVTTAAKIFNLAKESVSHDQRAAAKTVNFGIVYGQSAFTLAKQLAIPMHQAKLYIEQYFEQYPGVLKYRETVLQEVRQNGVVRTLLGRLRQVPLINATNQMQRAMAERLAFNTVLQGTAADIIKMAMIKLHNELKNFDAKILLQVHDELVLECETSIVDKVSQLCKSVMENIITLKVPLTVNVASGPNWDAAH